MNSIKSLLVVTVLAAVTYGVYVSLNQPAPGPPPDGAPVDWNVAPLSAAPVHVGTPAPAGDAPPLWAQNAVAAPPAFDPAQIPQPTAPVAAPLAAAPQEYASSQPPTDAAAAPAYQPAPDYQPAAAPPVYDQTGAPSSVAPVAPADVSQSAPPVEAVPATDVAGGSPAGSAIDFAGLISHVNSLLNQGHLTTAQLTLSESFHHFDDPALSADQRLSLYGLLDELTGTVIYSREHLLEQAYIVQPGDTLDRVATAYGVPWQLLAKINALDTSQPLAVGQSLKVVRGPFSAFVELGHQRLTLWLNGRYAGRFAVSQGQDAPAADGEFAILDKVENPAYFGAAGSVAPGDPQNPLGRHWLDLGNRLGIHAARDAAPHDPRGYFRLAPSDAEELYDILTVGSRVYIQR